MEFKQTYVTTEYNLRCTWSVRLHQPLRVSLLLRTVSVASKRQDNHFALDAVTNSVDGRWNRTRVLQEARGNVGRHARAKAVRAIS